MRRNISDVPQFTCRFQVSENKVEIRKVGVGEGQKKKHFPKTELEMEILTLFRKTKDISKQLIRKETVRETVL